MKKMRKIVATALVAAMALSTTVSAAEWNTEGGESTVTGDSSVVTPVIEVALPGDLAFEIDPYMVKNQSQISGGDYNVVNYSNVAVEVKVQPSIVKYTELADDGVTENDVSVLEIPATAPATTQITFADSSTRDLYEDITTTAAGKKAVYLIAIPADKATDLIDTNADGVYEFSYDAGTSNIGRTANVTTDLGLATESFAYGVPAIGAGADEPYALSLQKYGVADPAVSFTFVLAKENGTTDVDTEVYTPALDSVASFTVGGAVDAKAGLVDGDVQIQAVYKLATLSKNQKASLDSNTSGQKGISTTKQQLEIDVP